MQDANTMRGSGARTSGDNGLGIAGFICSLLGLIACGLLSPVGLILSLFGLRREPRGLAITGVVLGLFGICGWIVGLIVFGSMLAVMLAAVGLGGVAMAVGGPQIESGLEMANIAREVDLYKQRTGQLPASLDLLPVSEPAALIDPWGRRYEFTLSEDGVTYTLFSAGPDGTPGTPDDVQPWSEADGGWAWGRTKPGPPPAPTPSP